MSNSGTQVDTSVLLEQVRLHEAKKVFSDALTLSTSAMINKEGAAHDDDNLDA